MSLKSTKTVFIITAFSFLLLFVFSAHNLFAIPPVEKIVLPNGLIVLVAEEHSLPFATIQLVVNAGSSKDPRGQEGLSYLTSRCLLLGTEKKTASQISQELDFIGASLDTSADRDYVALNLRVLKKDLDKGFGLLIEAFTQPVFPEGEMAKEVRKALAAIQSMEDSPGAVADKEFDKALFLEGPYGHPTVGTKESLPNLTREMMVDFYKTYYHTNGGILTIVGDVTMEEVKTKILPHLEKLPAGKAYVGQPDMKFAKGPETLKLNRPVTQANIIMGNQGIRRSDPDYYALNVMNYILGGGGFASRLVEAIRNKKGLAYSVTSFFETGKYPGSFQIAIQTKNKSALEAIDLARKEIKRIQEQPVSAKELEAAKKYLIGSFPLRLDNQAKLAGFLSQVEYYGLGLDYPQKYPSLIASVTAEDILRVAKAYIHPENFVLVIVANLEEAGMEQIIQNPK